MNINHQSQQQLIETARRLTRAGNYREALVCLESTVAEDFDAQGQAQFHLAAAEALIFLGNYDHNHLDHAIPSLRTSSDDSSFALAKYLKGWQLQATGHPVEAKECLIEAFAAYRRIEDLGGAARALNRLAIISFQAGEIGQAIENLSRVKEIREASGDLIGVTGAQHNLASIFFMSGNLSKAIRIFEHTRPEFPQLTTSNQCVALLCHGMALALSGQLACAQQLLNQAEGVSSSSERGRAQYLEYLGWIRLLEGEPADAKKVLETCLELARQIAPQSALVAQPLQLMADACLALKDWNKAEELAREALVIAEKITERVVVAACWRVFAQVENHKRNHDKAREWSDKAIDLFHQIGARYELAVTRYLAATSGLYDHHKRTALLYLAKEYFESEQVTPFIEKVAKALETETPRITKPKPKAADAGTTIIGTSKPLRRILDLVDHVAPSDLSILLTGETGTGKDLLARYIHACSDRTGEFVHVNAAGIPAEMIEDELFGHIKGAFTGANADRTGLFEQAAEGTFYLDEIADATPQFQAKLLQVLETCQVRPLGQNALRPVTCRLIAATNHDLREVMKTNGFRPDLFHRLNDLTITLPPLRERPDDIPLLVEHFLQEAGVSTNHNGDAQTLERLCTLLAARPWPGNVRELRKFVQRLAVIGERNLGRIVELSQAELSNNADQPNALLITLEATGWNRRETARRLGLSEATIRRRIAEQGLTVPEPD